MKKIIQLFIAILIMQNSFAQLEPNPKTNFYLYGGSSFVNAVYNQNNTYTFSYWGTYYRSTQEGHAQLNNPTNGNLIFTTDGRTANDPSGNTILNGTGLLGTTSSTNAASIIPMDAQFGFLVTTSDTYSPPPNVANNFAYYSVYQTGLTSTGLYNPSINSLKKNIQLLAPGINQFQEKAVVIRKIDNPNFYLIMHSAEGPNNDLVVFKNSGTNIIHHGTYALGTTIKYDMGQIRCSSIDLNGNCKVVAAYSNMHKIEVYNFNFNTGVLSFDITYDFSSSSAWPYGLEISPNGKMVYFSDYSTFGKLYCIDLGSGNISSFQNTATNKLLGISTYEKFGQLMSLDNGSIYFPIKRTGFLCRIQNPNTFGLLNSFVINATNTVPLLNIVSVPQSLFLGLPNYNRL
jgi:hypothetical protein